MALVITLYRLILIFMGLGAIHGLIPVLTISLFADGYQAFNKTGYIIGILLFLGLLAAMWQMPYTFLRLATKDAQLLTIKSSESITFQQIVELTIFLMGLFFFLYGIDQLKDIIIMTGSFDISSESQLSLSYNGAKLVSIVFFTAVAFAVMYYHRRIACFFFRR